MGHVSGRAGTAGRAGRTGSVTALGLVIPFTLHMGFIGKSNLIVWVSVDVQHLVDMNSSTVRVTTVSLFTGISSAKFLSPNLGYSVVLYNIQE